MPGRPGKRQRSTSRTCTYHTTPTDDETTTGHDLTGTSWMSAAETIGGFCASSEVNHNEYEHILAGLSDHDKDIGERLRRHLQFFFMDPLMKWRVRRQFPFKLFLQILKIIFITIQLILFAELRMSHIDFIDDTSTVMRHKFLKDWNDERDALVYPPSSGRYSVFTGPDIIDQFAFMIDSYYMLQDESFASFSYDTSLIHREDRTLNGVEAVAVNKIRFDQIPFLELCINRIANVTVFNDTYEFDISEIDECFKLNFTEEEVQKIHKNSWSLEEILHVRGINFKPEDALIISRAELKFKLRTIHFSPVSTDQRPECYLIAVTITFDNSRHTGQVFISLLAEISYVNLCNGRVLKGGGLATDAIVIGVIDVIVLVLCIASFILCCRAVIRAHLLKTTTCDYFEYVLKRKLSLSDEMEFLNLWYVMIVINDICIALGTVFKISIEFRDFDSDLFTTTGILLGIGALLVYVGVLRYFCFFSKYNILILTMKRALPNILRFMSCAAVLYMGFLIAGWVIIGPYSLKFRTLGKSSEALFSLLNGDDMFATFFTINDSNTTIKIFGTVYIYVFVSLFIYIVLSLFIAIIMDAYEIIKERYNGDFKLEYSALREFASSDWTNVQQHISMTSTDEIRQQYSPRNLIRLDTINTSECFNIFSRFREWYRTKRTNGTNDAASGASSAANFYNSFTNPNLIQAQDPRTPTTTAVLPSSASDYQSQHTTASNNSPPVQIEGLSSPTTNNSTSILT